MSSRALSRGQQERVAQFVGVTGSAPRVAQECLQVCQWSVEAAVDYYYSSGMSAYAERASAQPRLDRGAISRLYQRYKDPDSDAILAEGVEQLCTDLGIDPMDPVLVVLSWHLGAEVMCEYSRQEFEGGLAKLGADNVEKLRGLLPQLRAQLVDPSKFRDIYQYAYLFSRWAWAGLSELWGASRWGVGQMVGAAGSGAGDGLQLLGWLLLHQDAYLHQVGGGGRW